MQKDNIFKKSLNNFNSLTADQIDVENITLNNRLKIPQGTASEPSIYFDDATDNSGIYSEANGRFNIALNGQEKVQISSSLSAYETALSLTTDEEDMLEIIDNLSSNTNLKLRQFPVQLQVRQTGADTIPIYSYGNDTLTGLGLSENLGDNSVNIISNATIVGEFNTDDITLSTSTTVKNNDANGFVVQDNSSNTNFKVDNLNRQNLVNDGSSASPAMAFFNDIDTGMYLEAANQIGFSANGSTALRIAETSSTFDTFVISNFSGGYVDLNGTNTGGVCASSGTAGNPSFSNYLDSDTGMYFPAADELGFSTNGGERVNLSNSNLTIRDNTDLRIENASTIRFQRNDSNYGQFNIYPDSSNTTDLHIEAIGGNGRIINEAERFLIELRTPVEDDAFVIQDGATGYVQLDAAAETFTFDNCQVIHNQQPRYTNIKQINSSSYTVLAGDHILENVFTTSPPTWTLPDIGTSGFENGSELRISNYNTGNTLGITCNATDTISNSGGTNDTIVDDSSATYIADATNNKWIRL